MLKSLDLKEEIANAAEFHPLRPVGATADLVCERADRLKGVPLLYVAQTSRRAQDLVEILAAFEPERPIAYFPAWDSLPGDSSPPSRAVMGRRMSVLRWMTDATHRPTIVVATAEALIRRVPPRSVWQDTHVELRVGEGFDPERLATHLERIGYVVDERVDEAGEVAFRGQVMDIFPAAAPMPCRVEHTDGRITSIRAFDPASQRSFAPCDMLIVDPANELVAEPGGPAPDPFRKPDLPAHYGTLASFLDYVPDAAILIEEGIDRRADAFYATVEEARADAPDHRAARQLASAFEDQGAWSRAVAGVLDGVVAAPEEADEHERMLPRFAEDRDPWGALRAFRRERGGQRLVFAADASLLPTLLRRAERALGQKARRVSGWSQVRQAEPGEFLAFAAPLEKGFVVPDAGLACVCAADVVGMRAGVPSRRAESAFFNAASASFEPGDAVVHLDHGVGVFEALEPLDAAAGTEALRLRYAREATLLVPLRDIGAVWRYGAAADGLKLDSLKGGGWIERRNAVLGDIRRTADGIVALSRERAAQHVEPARPDPRFYERFCGRFPFELTRDQAAAVEDVLGDLATGRAMDRLVCGDVGFGKTEVALRAAAAMVSAGRQVAIAAPTTILAQQHHRLFERRFAPFGIGVAQLSRLASPAEAKAVRAGLADGSIRVVVGTHSLAAKGTEFAELGLVVIDEEQRFGRADKEKLRALGRNAHVLTMTATPIPRTLQAGLAGLQAISVIATAPNLRRPTETRQAPFDDEEIRELLLRERRRGGQSFVVCPRIEDIEPMRKRLGALLPDLSVTLLHGRMDAAEIDAAMLAFAGGEGDVLLATNIIESGLDVPAANTIVVWHPDRFGLAQLHQLRGRVGRGSRRGVMLLATDPEHDLPDSARTRLAALAGHDRLGAGFELSLQDLDSRGAGDLLGEEQAGHLQLIGLSLYRHFLSRALEAADGDGIFDDWSAEIALGIEGTIPEGTVPEPELRIDLAVRIDRIRDVAALEVLKAETVDRFGPLPEGLDTAFRLAALRIESTELGIRRLDGGPKAIAADFEREAAERVERGLGGRIPDGLRWKDARLVNGRSCETPARRLELAEAFVERIAGWSRKGRAALTSKRRREHAPAGPKPAGKSKG